MKYALFRVRSLSLLTGIFLVLGCGDGITESVVEPELSVPVPTQAAMDAAGVIESANGSGHSARPAGFITTFTFNAVKRADGRVTGQALYQNGIRLKVEIDCLAVDGNVAVLSGTLKQHSNPMWVGAGGYFVVEDNGEGVQASPDRVSALWGTNDFQPQPEFCHEVLEHLEEWIPPPWQPFGGWFEVERGNVQVKGGVAP